MAATTAARGGQAGGLVRLYDEMCLRQHVLHLHACVSCTSIVCETYLLDVRVRAACVCCSCVYVCTYHNMLNLQMHEIGDRAVGWINSSQSLCSY